MSSQTSRPHSPPKRRRNGGLTQTLFVTMRILNIAGTEYSFTRGSDVVRDGMFLEAYAVGDAKRRTVAEVFYSDSTDEFYVSCFEEHVPVELVEYLIEEGRKCLPPASRQ